MSAISIAMPYYDRQLLLDRSMAAYHELYHDLDLDFFICDDGSPKPVIAHGCTIITLPEKDYALNPCVPINRAINASKSDVIVLTNPEVWHKEPILKQMRELLVHQNDYVMARCWDIEREMWVADDSVDYSTDGRLPVPEGAHFHFCTMFHRSLWEVAGGFDESYRHGQACDDNDWLWRLHEVGANFKLCDAVVYHHKSKVQWKLPHNKTMFLRKWPQLSS